MGSCVFVYCLKYLRGRDINNFSSRPLTSLDNWGFFGRKVAVSFLGSLHFLSQCPFTGRLCSELAKANAFRGLCSVLKVRIPHSQPSHKVTFS